MSPIRAPFDTPTAVFGIPNMSPKEPTLSWWLGSSSDMNHEILGAQGSLQGGPQKPVISKGPGTPLRRGEKTADIQL